MVGIAFLGCGYVANMYRLTLALHPELELVGVFDRERARRETMAGLSGARAYPDLAALCADRSVQIVLNLTNPSEHFETTRALLEAGKHVYSEKPLAMRLEDAMSLANLAKNRGLMLTSAPCTVMNPVAQTLWRAVKDQVVGRIRLIHAEMEDGMVHRAPVGKWVNEAGMAWPAVDEFQSGCTVEHSGYVLSWLCAIFGPVQRLTAHTEVLVEEKIPGLSLAPAADLSVATMRFSSGTVARLTNGIYAPHDHRLRLFGDEGVIEIEDPRSDTSPVRVSRYVTVRRRRFLSPIRRRLRPSSGREAIPSYRGSQVRDFCRAVGDMAHALREGRPPYIGTDLSLHVTEVTLACQRGVRHDDNAFGIDPSGMPYSPRTTFGPMEPLA